jgi:hypothetical protein
MLITHQEARRLIQRRADEALLDVDRNLLDAHLDACAECQKYAADTSDLEATLQHLMQRRWDHQPLPLSREQTVSGKPIHISQSIFFATRIVAMGVICLAFLFNIWQFTQPSRQRATPPAAEIPLIPTPALQSMGVQATDQTCEPILYEVKEDDTIESIAARFSIPAREILSTNHLTTETLNTAVKLTIPVCSPTPPGTPNIVSTTFTPLLDPNTITPISVSTQ